MKRYDSKQDVPTARIARAVYQPSAFGMWNFINTPLQLGVVIG